MINMTIKKKSREISTKTFFICFLNDNNKLDIIPSLFNIIIFIVHMQGEAPSPLYVSYMYMPGIINMKKKEREKNNCFAKVTHPLS